MTALGKVQEKQSTVQTHYWGICWSAQIWDAFYNESHSFTCHRTRASLHVLPSPWAP